MLAAMQITAVHTARPPHYYNQEQLLAAFQAMWATQHHNPRRVEQLHKAVRVGGRHLALPMDAYDDLDFTSANQAFIRVGTDLAEQAIQGALDAAGLKPTDVDALYFASVTGISAPSIDALLVNRLGLRTDVKRIPIFGLGCVAGAAGTARLNDYLKGHKNGVAVLVCVELCSLTLQRKDLSIPNLIASGLFGDGAAAVVAVGDDHPAAGPVKVLDTKSRFYPDTERVMGWDIGTTGFSIVLSADVPNMVLANAREDVDAFLGEHDLTRDDITTWVCHTGGPKVLQAFETALELPNDALARSWHSLEHVGNLSSASVLHVLADTLTEPPPPGSKALMMAMGPGFCAEMVLLEWS